MRWSCRTMRLHEHLLRSTSFRDMSMHRCQSNTIHFTLSLSTTTQFLLTFFFEFCFSKHFPIEYDIYVWNCKLFLRSIDIFPCYFLPASFFFFVVEWIFKEKKKVWTHVGNWDLLTFVFDFQVGLNIPLNFLFMSVAFANHIASKKPSQSKWKTIGFYSTEAKNVTSIWQLSYLISQVPELKVKCLEAGSYMSGITVILQKQKCQHKNANGYDRYPMKI